MICLTLLYFVYLYYNEALRQQSLIDSIDAHQSSTTDWLCQLWCIINTPIYDYTVFQMYYENENVQFSNILSILSLYKQKQLISC